MAGTVVIGFDGSDSGEDALALGLLLCRATGATPVVAAVYPEAYPIGPGRVDAEWVAYMRERTEGCWGTRGGSSATGSTPTTGPSVPPPRPAACTSWPRRSRPRSWWSARPTAGRSAGPTPAAPATGELLEGDVVDALATVDRRDADLLVCGSRGYGPVRRVLLGGVSARLLRRAAIPLLVVPRGAGVAGAEAALGGQAAGAASA